MISWINQTITPPDSHFLDRATKYQTQLTKPPGSLGMLEGIAIRLAAMQETDKPSLDQVWVSVFAADHGIAEEGVSAFPQVVTAEMVKNFVNSGAAVNVLSHYVKASFEVIDAGLIDSVNMSGVIDGRVGKGTKNFSSQSAMTEAQMGSALMLGKSAVERALKQNAQLFIGGEMGIANTTSASAISAILTDLSVADLTGSGTGLNSKKVEYKVEIIENAILFHKNLIITPLNVLQYFGGFEIAALVGAYLFAAQQKLPVVIDGFISSVAALVAVKINAAANMWFFYGHQSQEKGHQLILKELKATPLLNLGLRLGEASGAVLAVPLLQMACKLHNEMATFEQAEITITSL